MNRSLFIGASLIVLSGCLDAQRDKFGIGKTDLERPVKDYVTFVQPGALNHANATNSNTDIRIETDTRDMTAVVAQEMYEMDLKDGQSYDVAKMEIQSHEIQSVVAVDRYGRELVKYRQRMASDMKLGYGCFAALTTQQLVNRMSRQHGKAVAWVEKYNPVLDEFEQLAASEGVENVGRVEAVTVEGTTP
jgi:hypothetical protein